MLLNVVVVVVLDGPAAAPSAALAGVLGAAASVQCLHFINALI